MFGRSSVLELMLPAALLYMTMWNIPPVRAGLICYGMSVAMITAF